MTVRRTKLDVEQYDLGSLRLYREDLRAIATAAAEAGDLAITCDGFEATSPEDFGDGLPEKLEKVTIRAANPDRLGSVEIRLSDREAVVQLTEPDTLLAGVVSRVRLICEPRRQHYPRALEWARRADSATPLASAALAFTVVLVSLGIIAENRWLTKAHSHGHSAGGVAAFVGVGIVAFAALSFFLLGAVRPWVEMINAPRADRPTYWQRTGDMWVVGVITALLGAVAGYLLGRFG